MTNTRGVFIFRSRKSSRFQLVGLISATDTYFLRYPNRERFEQHHHIVRECESEFAAECASQWLDHSTIVSNVLPCSAPMALAIDASDRSRRCVAILAA